MMLIPAKLARRLRCLPRFRRRRRCRRRPRMRKPVILLASSPEHALAFAKDYVCQHGGYCGAFTREHPINPQRVRISKFLEHLIRMDFAGMNFFVDDVVASWTMKQRWRWAWKGRVSAGLEMLQESHPGKTVNAVAIRGGPQCEWEVTQLMPGGEVRKQYPEFRLMVFDQLDDFVQAVESGAFGDVQKPSK